MALTIDEIVKSREWVNDGGEYSCTYKYVIKGVTGETDATESDAFLLLASTSPANILNPEGYTTQRASISVRGPEAGISYGDVEYRNAGGGGAGGRGVSNLTLSRFSIGGETIKIKQSIQTISA